MKKKEMTILGQKDLAVIMEKGTEMRDNKQDG